MTGKQTQKKRKAKPKAPVPGKTAGQASSALSEQLFRAIDAMADGVLLADADGKVIYVNRAMLSQSGFDQDDFIGQPMTSMWCQPDALTRRIMADLAENRTWRGLIQHKVNKGGLFWEAVTISPITDGRGTVTHFIKTGRTIDPPEDPSAVCTPIDTVYKNIRELKESEESYRRVMELAPDAITISRLSDGKYFEVNDAFCQQTGYTRREALGRTVIDLNLYATLADRERIVHALRAEGRISGMQVTFKHRDGSLLHDIVSARIIRFKGEDCLLFVGTLINPLVEAQHALIESEKKFRMILNAAPDAICLTRLEDGRYIEANDMFYQNTGYTAEETIGRTALDLGIYAKPEDRGRFVAALQQSGRVEGMEILTQYKDGSLSSQLWSGSVIEFNGEQCLLVVAKTIDELKAVQQQLRESEENYLRILNTAPYSIVITRRSDVTYVLVNDAFCKRTGYTREEAIGRTPFELNLYVDPTDRIRMMERLQRDGQLISMEVAFRSKSGEILESLISSSPIVLRGEVCLLTMTMDIREQKKAQLELEKYRLHLEEMVQERTRALEAAQNELIKREKLSVLGQLTATVSHELRNPLGVIRSSNFFLMRKVTPRDEKVDKHLKRIEEQVTLCDAIVADLLEFTRGRQSSLAKEAIRPWLEKVVDQMRETENIDIKMDIAGDLPLVPHDQEKMRRVVINLLDNAVQAVRVRQKAAQARNEPYLPMVMLKAASRGKDLLLQVLDNGCGMDETTRRRAFEPLFTTRARGTGIGLANVSKIVSEHGGRVELVSELDQGTTMTVVLPYEMDHPRGRRE